MSIDSSSGEVFGANVFYGAMIVMSLVLLLASVSGPPAATAVPVVHAPAYAVETVVVTAKPGKVS